MVRAAETGHRRAVGVPDTGFVLTAAEVSADALVGSSATVPISTEGCD